MECVDKEGDQMKKTIIAIVAAVVLAGGFFAYKAVAKDPACCGDTAAGCCPLKK